MKTFIITETYTGYCEYEVDAQTKEEAIKLYEDGEYRETQQARFIIVGQNNQPYQ